MVRVLLTDLCAQRCARTDRCALAAKLIKQGADGEARDSSLLIGDGRKLLLDLHEKKDRSCAREPVSRRSDRCSCSALSDRPVSRSFRADCKVDLLARTRCQLRPQYVESDRALCLPLQPLLSRSQCLLQYSSGLLPNLDKRKPSSTRSQLGDISTSIGVRGWVLSTPSPHHLGLPFLCVDSVL